MPNTTQKLSNSYKILTEANRTHNELKPNPASGTYAIRPTNGLSLFYSSWGPQ